MSDEAGAFMLSLSVGLVVLMLSILSIVAGPNSYIERSHRFLGSKGGPCFANNTCREKLVCLHGDGAEPGICAVDQKAAGR